MGNHGERQRGELANGAGGSEFVHGGGGADGPGRCVGVCGVDGGQW